MSGQTRTSPCTDVARRADERQQARARGRDIETGEGRRIAGGHVGAAGRQTCPDCAESIRASARKCRFCGWTAED